MFHFIIIVLDNIILYEIRSRETESWAIATQYASFNVQLNPQTRVTKINIERIKIINIGFIYIIDIFIKIMWKTIKDFERYEIDENGKIKNIKTSYLLKSTKDKDGYLQIGLRKEGIRKKIFF